MTPPRSRAELLTRRADLARRRRSEERAAWAEEQDWPDNARTRGQLGLVGPGPRAVHPHLELEAVLLQLHNARRLVDSYRGAELMSLHSRLSAVATEAEALAKECDAKRANWRCHLRHPEAF